MSLKFKLLAAAAAAAFALPAGAQVTGSRLPTRAETQAETQGRAAVEAPADAKADVGAEAEAAAEAGPQAVPTADAEVRSDVAAEEGAQADEAAAPAGQPADAGAQARTAGAGEVVLATAADIREGVLVQDPQGGPVGTVETVEADGAVVTTGSVRAKLPFESFGKNERGLVISMTRAEFEAAVAAQTAS